MSASNGVGPAATTGGSTRSSEAAAAGRQAARAFMASDAGSALRRTFDAARAFAAAPPPVIALSDRDYIAAAPGNASNCHVAAPEGASNGHVAAASESASNGVAALKRPSSTGPKLAKRPATAGANLAKRPAAAEGNARGPKEFPPSEIFGYRSDLRLSPLTLAWAPDPNRQWMTNGDLPSAQRVTNGDIVLSLQVVPKSVNWQDGPYGADAPMVQMVLSRWHTTISVSGRVRCARKAPGILLARPEEWKSAAFPLECHYYECKNCHMDVKLAVPIPYTRAGYSRYYDWTDYKIACAGCMFHHASALARKYLLQSQRKVVMAPKEFEMKYSGMSSGDEIGTVRQ